MPEVGEEIVGSWLRYCEGCEFVDYNVELKPGEIDVIGVNLAEGRAYLCEVAAHTQGLGYKDIEETLHNKFKRAVEYAASNHLKDFRLTYMFWAPVVRSGNQSDALAKVQRSVSDTLDVHLQLVTNKEFVKRLEALRDVARKRTRDSPTPRAQTHAD